MLESVGVDQKKIEYLLTKPEKFAETIYKGLVNRDL